MSWRFLTKRVLAALATLAFVLIVNFFLFRVLGDPARTIGRSQRLDPQELAELRAVQGTDKPVFPDQFLIYARNTFTGDFGTTFKSSLPVTEVIASRAWPTVLLVGTATLLSTVIGVFLGIKGGWKHGSLFDRSSLLGSMALYSMPEFFLGMVLIIVFAAGLGWFPTGGYQSPDASATGLGHWLDVLQHLFLPCLTLTLVYIGEYSLIMRSSILDVVGEDFVGTARAKGIREKFVLRRHVVPNALLPTVTVTVLYFGFLLAGSIGVEYVFSYPGLGLMTAQAIDDYDFPLLQGVFLIFSAAVIAANLLADILYGYLDPRVRVS